MKKDLSFQNLMQEGKKVRNSLSESFKKATSALMENKKIASRSDKTEQRLKICNKCPSLSKNSGRCEVCGCFVFLKVKLDFEECPVGKW